MRVTATGSGTAVGWEVSICRDLEESVRQQMHLRMSAPEYATRVAELPEKYAAPIREFPLEWDRALLNVYRADMTPGWQEGLRGRALLKAARDAKQRLGRARVLVRS